jgi:hypothetical protein
LSLYLIESILAESLQNKEVLSEKIEAISNYANHKNSRLVEVQIGNNFSHAFFIIEGENEDIARNTITQQELEVNLIKEVRLIGQEAEQTNTPEANYLVQWNLPEGLTMEKYLARKKEKSPLYDEVPDVDFIRTYVCEDMTKCLCFYKAPGEENVRKARDVVQAPVDSLTEITSLKSNKK